MARARNIKPGFFKNADLADKGPLAQLLFAGLWVIADRDGRLKDDPRWIRVECLPYYAVSDEEVENLLSALAGGDDPFIFRYEADGRRWLQVVKWQEHQSPHPKETESKIPCMSQAWVKHESSMDEFSKKPIHASVEECKEEECKEEETKNQESDGLVIEPAELRKAVDDWLAYKRERREAYKPQARKAFFSRVANLAVEHGARAVIDAMQRAMGNGWKGWDHDIGQPRGSPNGRTSSSPSQTYTPF